VDALVQLNSALSGRYAIDREVGAGGMATVYLARDVRHERNVALKVLNPELGAVLGVERFLSEIKVTANLQHPNLLPLFDSGEAEGLLFYVMPYVEGESLRARLIREKQLPIDEAVRIATAIASALDYAHRHGVIHRDLKPENILMHEGQPLIADFGIALAVSKAGGNRITQTGLSLGTPQYMSPEQATGDRTIDGRTDIYSLGAMLYEMLAGDPPHTASTSQAIIAKLLTDKPRSLRTLRPSVPVHVDAAIERALEKLPADRFATAHEFADALSGKLIASASGLAAVLTGAESVGTALGARRRFGRRDLAYAIGIVAVAGVGGGVVTAAWVHRHQPAPQPVVRFQLVLPKNANVYDSPFGTNLAISPTGDRLAYLDLSPTLGGVTLWVRTLDQLDAKLLTPQGFTRRTLAFSPDGRWIAFTEGNDVKKISVDGGPDITLASLPDLPYGLSWGTTGFLVAGTAGSGLFVIDEAGGEPQRIPTSRDERAPRFPLVLPTGLIAYQFQSPGKPGYRMAVESRSGTSRKTLDVPGSAALAFLNGQLIYATATGTLMAVSFDAHKGLTRGAAALPAAQDVQMDGFGGAKAAISASGTLVYRSGKSETRPEIVGAGAGPLLMEPRNYSTPRFSPDGRRVAFTIAATDGTIDVWVFDRSKGTLSRLTSEGNNQRPEWATDGKRIVFVSDRGGQPAFWWQPADGSAPAEMLYRPSEGDPFEALLSPDGHWLVYRTGPSGKPQRAIFAVQLDGERKKIPLVVTNTAVTLATMPRLSPDGHWLAYRSNETKTSEIYVRPFPGEGSRVQISQGGGTEPVWARSGKALYYRNNQDLVRVGVTTGTAFSMGERKVVATGDYVMSISHPNWDLSPDGAQYLMIRRAGEDVQTIVVHNWIRELMARTRAGGQ
jgi:serine/threonine-protein kinase